MVLSVWCPRFGEVDQGWFTVRVQRQMVHEQGQLTETVPPETGRAPFGP